MSTNKMKILFIGGTGRSGSTILGRILNEADGTFFVGELDRVWAQIKVGRGCVCGKPYNECEVWSPIFERAFGSVDKVDTDRLAEYQRRLSQEYLKMMFRSREWAAQTWVQEYREITERLYRAVFEVTGCRLLIDSSKGGAYNHFLSRIPSLQVYCLHLMRDPRAVLNTYIEFWQRRNRHGMVKVVIPTLLGWDKSQLLMEGWGRFFRGGAKYMQMRYEDFVAHPQSHAQRIFEFVEEPQMFATLPFKNERVITLGESHTTGGNARSNKMGDIELKRSERYLERLSQRDQLTSLALTLPLMLRHRYPLQPRSEGKGA